MEFPDSGTVIGVIGIALAIVAPLLVVRRERRKLRLSWWHESTPMANGSVEVTVNGVAVENPHLNAVHVAATGWSTIPEDSFDGRRPVEFIVGAGGAVPIENSEGEGQIAFSRGEGDGLEWARFVVPPQPIPRRARGYVTFISAGPTTVTAHEPTPIVDGFVTRLDGPSKLFDRAQRLLKRGVLLGAIAALILAASVALLVASLGLLGGLG